MRVVIQRVSNAMVVTNGIPTGEIGRGLLVLLGIEQLDSEEDVAWLTDKIRQLRIFGDDNQKMNLALEEIDGEIMVISQFTLHASTKKGNRPSFIKAARPEHAIPLYNAFIDHLNRHLQRKVHTGIFGADMQVSLTNDGPVTIIIDSKNKE